jgi:hypothetical protein
LLSCASAAAAAAAAAAVPVEPAAVDVVGMPWQCPAAAAAAGHCGEQHASAFQPAAPETKVHHCALPAQKHHQRHKQLLLLLLHLLLLLGVLCEQEGPA